MFHRIKVLKNKIIASTSTILQHTDIRQKGEAHLRAQEPRCRMKIKIHLKDARLMTINYLKGYQKGNPKKRKLQNFLKRNDHYDFLTIQFPIY